MVIKQKVEAKGFCIKNKKQKTEKTKQKKKRVQAKEDIFFSQEWNK